MKRHALTSLAALAAIVLASTSLGQKQAPQPAQPAAQGDTAQQLQQFLAARPAARIMQANGGIERIYGAALSNGPTALASAEAFRQANSAVFGVAANELVASAPSAGAPHVQPLMYNRATGAYKFSAVYYSQTKGGIPVFGSRLVLLARNQPNFPVVLASTSLRDLSQFNAPGRPAGAPDATAAHAAAAKWLGPAPRFRPATYVIWAGVDDIVAAPTLAIQFIGESGRSDSAAYRKILFLADAASGQILHTEDQIHHGDISGNVAARVTTGLGADTCGPEQEASLPYIEVVTGTTSVFADSNGDFVLPVASAAPVTVFAGVRGQFFDVFSEQGPDLTLSTLKAAPGPVDFLFNPDASDERDNAQVNAYLHANLVRDFALSINPKYPVIGNQTDFTINVNRDDTCNAGYSGESINFFHSGGGCTNTANSTVVYHEYGHHLVQVGGSGQGQYGEGMSDCVAVIFTDQPLLGLGFHGDCSEPLRNADNDVQYPCSGEIHSCGRLISGCIWSTRNELAATNPLNYRDILNNLTINSIPLHNGSSINPSITVDFLTLDDDDENILNGTPHYNEIAAGFGDHNMDAPALTALSISFPLGQPTYVSPAGGTTVRFVATGVTQLPQPGTGTMVVSINGGPFTSATVTQVSPNTYDGVFPPAACGSFVRYFVSALTTTATTVSSPVGAPGAGTHSAFGAAGAGPLTFDDNGEADPGWTVSNSSGLDGGEWERETPRPDCDRGNPLADGDGSGQCWLTQNSDGSGFDPCNSDVDGGTTTLTSPTMDASGTNPKIISYYRWYSNTQGSDPEDDTFVVEVSSNGGTSWVNLETVGPAGAEVDGGWFFKQFRVADFVPMTSQFRIRFRAADLGGGSVIEAGVDGVKLTPLVCTAPLTGDLNLDGHVNGLDLAILLSQWTGAATAPGCPPSPAADFSGDCRINGIDLAMLLSAWTG